MPEFSTSELQFPLNQQSIMDCDDGPKSKYSPGLKLKLCASLQSTDHWFEQNGNPEIVSRHQTLVAQGRVCDDSSQFTELANGGSNTDLSKTAALLLRPPLVTSQPLPVREWDNVDKAPLDDLKVIRAGSCW